jgi:hypothetical protein
MNPGKTGFSSLISHIIYKLFLFLARSVNKDTEIAPWKENLLGHNFVSERGYVLEMGNAC